MKKIRLENFAQMHPETPEYSQKNQHYLLSGADPSYFLAQNAVQEQVIGPLAAARAFATIATLTDGSYVASLAPAAYSAGGVSYDAIASTDLGHFFGIAANGTVTDLKNLAQASAATGSVSVFNQKIWYNYANSVSLFARPLDDGSGSWSSILSLNGTNNFTRPMKNFLDFMAVPDSPGGAFTGKHQLRKVTSGNVFATGIDLGLGWDIIGLENFNNRFLAVAAGYMGNDTTSIASFSSEYYVFLWDGISSTYKVPLKVPGIPLDMKCIGTELYVLVQERTGQIALYIVAGTNLKFLFYVAIDTVRTGPITGLGVQITGKMGFALFEYAGMLGINLLSKGQYLVGKDNRFILTSQNLDAVLRAGSGGALIATSGMTVSLYGTNYSPISYKSQWIPVDNLAAIDVYYATPPQSGTDAINVTLDGFDEDGTASTNLALNSITPTSFYNSYRTRLDVQGFTGRKARVSLGTVNASTWQPIIRYIDLIVEQ